MTFFPATLGIDSFTSMNHWIQLTKVSSLIYTYFLSQTPSAVNISDQSFNNGFVSCRYLTKYLIIF